MEALLELIFGNFFIVLLVIVGILGFLRDNAAKQKEEEKQRRSRPTRPAPPSSRGQRPARSAREGPASSSGRSTLDRARETISSSSIEEQQKEQMEKLASRFNTQANEAMEDLQEGVSATKSFLREADPQDLSKDQVQIKKGVSKSLRGKGLINGIIMSEVLGPPRARKPYRNIVAERKNG